VSYDLQDTRFGMVHVVLEYVVNAAISPLLWLRWKSDAAILFFQIPAVFLPGHRMEVRKPSM
jgi:hypothetical protein